MKALQIIKVFAIIAIVILLIDIKYILNSIDSQQFYIRDYLSEIQTLLTKIQP